MFPEIFFFNFKVKKSDNYDCSFNDNFQIGSLLNNTRYAGSGVVADNFWHIFGGFQNSLDKSQKFDIATSTWTEGLALYESKKAFGHCTLLV
jgi:hypothetical protein